MPWVLKLTESNGKYRAGAYVADPGRGATTSYTYKLEHAERFHSRELADAYKCGNETAIEL